MACSSIVRWDNLAGLDNFERLSVYDCHTKQTWSAWSDEHGNLIQGLVPEELGGKNEFLVPLQQSLRSTSESDKDFNIYPLIGPTISFILCSLVFATLYRRRNLKKTQPSSLAEHERVPITARIFVPFLLFLTVALFSFSNAAVGATVKLSVQIFGAQVIEYSLFDFSLVNTIRDMWDAKVYVLSGLVAIWSGAWPYLKCMLMGATWFCPPSVLKPSHRRRLLISLDILGKWALLDLFLMNMMSIGFRFHITTATINYVPKRLATVDVKVAPEIGLFLFTTAVALSLISNHIILAYHRNIVSTEDVDDGRRGESFHVHEVTSSPDARERLLEQPSAANSNIDSERMNDELVEDAFDSPKYCINFPEGSWFDVGTSDAFRSKKKSAIHLAMSRISVASHTFSHGTLPRILLNQKGHLYFLGKVFLFLFSSLVFCLIVASGVEDTFEFVFSGLAGDLIRIVDPPQAVRRCSLLSIAKALGEDQEKGHAFGVFYLQSLYILFAFVFPLIVLFLAVLMLFLPFTLREAKILFYALEVVSAWAALDVFIVAIISAVVQINQFSHFLEGPYCDPIKEITGLKECFGVETQLLKGCWLILAAASCLWCFVQFVQRVSERAIADREEEIIKRVDTF